MLSRQEVTMIGGEEAKEKTKWLSMACCDSGTLRALCLTASAVLRKPTKERKEKLGLLIKQLHDKGIYHVDTVIDNIKEYSEG